METPMFQTYKQKGFGLPVAIFIITILAIFVVAATKLALFSTQSSNFNINRTKAHYAAKLGLDYGFYQAVKNNTCSSTPNTININENYFVGFNASYSCEEFSSEEAGITTKYYKITSYGCNNSLNSCPTPSGKPSSENYAEKQLIGIIMK